MKIHPYAEHIGQQVTVTPRHGNPAQGHLWRITPDLVRIITDADQTRTIALDDIKNLEPTRWGVGDRVRVVHYSGAFEATVTNLLPGRLTLATDDDGTASVAVPPQPGVTLTNITEHPA